MSDPSRHEVQPGTGLKLSHHREWAEMKPGVITPGSFRNAAPRRPFIRLLVLALLGWQPVAGWWDTGHMLTAAIARTRLSAAARTMADELVIASASVQSSSPVPSVSFVSAAHWADDLKRRDWPASEKVHIAPDGLIVAFDAAQLNSMHYIDLPFEDGAFCSTNVLNERANILTALRNHNRTLADSRVNDWTRGIALRYFLHLVGDLHQPLHCASRCTVGRPHGDDGGNNFRLSLGSSAGPVTNLHSMWDSMGGAYIDTLEDVRHPDGTRSFGCTPASACIEIEHLRTQAVEDEAHRLLAEFSDDAIRAANATDNYAYEWYQDVPTGDLAGTTNVLAGDYFSKWATESYRLALAMAYQTAEGETPSEEYVAAVQRESKRRVVVGGVRLAAALEAAHTFTTATGLATANTRTDLTMAQPSRRTAESCSTYFQLFLCAALFAVVGYCVGARILCRRLASRRESRRGGYGIMEETEPVMSDHN